MLSIYTIPESLYCAKLRILLRHKKLQWCELPPPGGYGSEEYKKIVPSGNLPAIVGGDLLIADSEAIAEYLNEKFPDPPMLAEDLVVKAKARERSRFHDTRLEPELRALFPHIHPQQRDPAIVEIQSRVISTRLQQLSKLLIDPGPELHDALTLGDCGFPITFTWIEMLTPILELAIEWPDRVIAYRDHNAQHPAVAAELADYQPKLTEWLESKMVI